MKASDSNSASLRTLYKPSMYNGGIRESEFTVGDGTL